MSASEFKAPLYKLVYGDNHEQAFMQGYNLEGKSFSSPPRIFNVANLPILVFQLIDAGYIVMKDNAPPGSTILVASSREYVDHLQIKHASIFT